MNIFNWIIFGALAGWIARTVMGRKVQWGALADMVTGIMGALISGFLMTLFGMEGVEMTGFDVFRSMVAVIGAAALVFLVDLVRVMALPR